MDASIREVEKSNIQTRECDRIPVNERIDDTTTGDERTVVNMKTNPDLFLVCHTVLL